MKIRYILLCVLSGTLLFLPACGVQPPSVKADITFLTSPQCDGRLPGTEGNQKAEAYIAEQFERCGLSPLGNSEDFFQPYTQMTFDPRQSTQTLTAAFADGREVVLRSGRDFYPYLMTDRGFSGTVARDAADPGLDKLVLRGAGEQAAPISVLASKMATAHIDYGEPLLRLDPARFQTIKECQTLTLEGTLETRESTVNNLVGVWKGADSSKAVLVTAHFDHVGGYGETFYPGALDNASGTAALLELVRQLTSSTKMPRFDVVFCAFNGEDMGRQGSMAFASDLLPLLPYRTINVLNLDFLGKTGAEGLVVSTEDADLSQQLCGVLMESGLECVQGEVGMSDHVTFQSVGIPAVCLSSMADFAGLLHVPEDNVRGVDTEDIARTAGGLRNYLLQADVLKAVAADELSEDQFWEEANCSGAEAVAAYGPDRDEMVSFAVRGEPMLAWDISPLVGLEAVLAEYPTLLIPKALGEFEFESLFWSYGEELVQVRRDTRDGAPAPGTVHEKTAAEQSDYYILRCQSKEGSALHLQVRNSADRTLEKIRSSYYVESKSIGGATFYVCYQEVDGRQMFLQVCYYEDSLPLSFSLQSEDLWDALDAEEMCTIMAESLPDIKRLTQLKETSGTH